MPAVGKSVATKSSRKMAAVEKSEMAAVGKSRLLRVAEISREYPPQRLRAKALYSEAKTQGQRAFLHSSTLKTQDFTSPGVSKMRF